MRIDCDKKRDRLAQWHQWFAWHPVRLDKNDCRWWETVERKGEERYAGNGFYWAFEYREINQGSKGK